MYYSWQNHLWRKQGKILTPGWLGQIPHPNIMEDLQQLPWKPKCNYHLAGEICEVSVLWRFYLAFSWRSCFQTDSQSLSILKKVQPLPQVWVCFFFSIQFFKTFCFYPLCSENNTKFLKVCTAVKATTVVDVPDEAAVSQLRLIQTTPEAERSVRAEIHLSS